MLFLLDVSLLFGYYVVSFVLFIFVLPVLYIIFFFCISVFVFMQSLDFSVILLRVYLRSKRELKHFLGVERWVACSRPSLLDYSQCSRGCCQSMRLKTSFPSVLFEFQSARKLQKVVKI